MDQVSAPALHVYNDDSVMPVFNTAIDVRRNEVWRYNTAVWGPRRLRILKFLFTGIQWGFPAAVATIAFEEYFEVYKHHGDGHGHDDKPGHH